MRGKERLRSPLTASSLRRPRQEDDDRDDTYVLNEQVMLGEDENEAGPRELLPQLMTYRAMYCVTNSHTPLL